jgi:8-oxo-dGTP pyrophosphatase MutT (NUDIX family)
MNSFAAGIIPYTIFNKKHYFLLGLEKSNRKWSGFVGKSEPGETPKQTALREFHEETKCLFHWVKDLNTPPIIDKTRTGKIVYIWFVKFPVETFFMDLSKFYSISLPKQFEEKSELWWFNTNEIQNGNVLYQLKKIISLHW